MNRFYIFFCFVTVIASVSAINYCDSSLCKVGVAHIACGNSGNFSTPCPADVQLVDIQTPFQNIIVSRTNSYRNFVAIGGNPKFGIADRMGTIEWDQNLAILASFKVKQCVMARDKCHNTNDFKYSGQNIAFMSYGGIINNAAMLKQAIDIWYSEEKYINMEYINDYPNVYTEPPFANFAVMMIDRNVRLGCSAVTYSETGTSNMLFACDYATTATATNPIYASGTKAGAGCTTGTNPDYNGLCSTAEVYHVNKWI